MKELKEKIVLLRLFRIMFGCFFVTGAILFILFNIFEGQHFVRNAAISLVLMTSGYGFVEFYGYKINQYLDEFRALKSAKTTKKTVVIEFDKIA